MTRVIFHPEAEAEFLAAARFYDSHTPGLGLEFIAEVRRATRILANHPDIGHRFSRRLARRLTLTPGAESVDATNKLGDWYANTLNVGHRRLVFCVSEKSLLSVVLPALDLWQLASRLPQAVRLLLARLGVPVEIAETEVGSMLPISIGLTRNRSIVGSMVDLGRGAAFLLAPRIPRPPVADVELALAGVPCLQLQPHVFPFRAVGALLGVAVPTPEWQVLHGEAETWETHCPTRRSSYRA